MLCCIGYCIHYKNFIIYKNKHFYYVFYVLLLYAVYYIDRVISQFKSLCITIKLYYKQIILIEIYVYKTLINVYNKII